MTRSGVCLFPCVHAGTLAYPATGLYATLWNQLDYDHQGSISLWGIALNGNSFRRFVVAKAQDWALWGDHFNKDRYLGLLAVTFSLSELL